MKFEPSGEFMRVKDEALALPKMPSNKDRLELYGLYKQTTVGDINKPEPYFMIGQDGMMWKAWNNAKGTSREDAQKRYIAKVRELQGIKPVEGQENVGGPNTGSGENEDEWGDA